MNKSKIIAYTIGPIGAAAIGFITIPIITWFYSMEDIGRISMLPVVINFSIILFSLGLDQAYARGYYEALDKSSLLKITALPGLILILFFYGLILIVKPSLISELLYNIPSELLSIITTICFILAFISRFLSLNLRMEERALAYSMSQLIPKFLFLILVLCSVWLGFKKDIYNLVLANTLTFLTVFLVLIWNTRDHLFVVIKSKISYKELKSVLLFGFPLIIGGLSFWTLSVIDKFSLRYFSTFKELGLYTVAMSVTGVVAIFSGIFNTIWSPLVYKWISEEESVNISKIDDISYYLLAAIYFIVIISGLFSWVLVFLLPNSYYSLQYLIPVCILAPLLYTLSETSSIGIAITRKTYFSMIASVCAMILNLLISYILVPYYGAMGAAFSTTSSFLFFYILKTELSKKIWIYQQRKNTYFIIYLLFFACSVNLIYPLYMFNKFFLFFTWFILLLFGIYKFRDIIVNLKRVYGNGK